MTQKTIEALGQVGVQSVISLMLVGTCSWLWVNQLVVPAELLILTSSVVMHWLGRKTAHPEQERVAPVFIPE